MKAFASLIICLFAAELVAQDATSDGLTLSSVFGSHAVIQSGTPVPVWGRAKPESEVTVSFSGQTARAKADAGGRWKAVLQPMPVSFDPKPMVVSDGSERIALGDVLVGEVWLVCGRSNIGFPVSGMTEAASELTKADQPLLRLLKVSTKDPSAEPADDFKTNGWAPASANGKAVREFSAVGWVFGSELQKARKVPVGIVMSSWGGSRPSMWIESAFYGSKSPSDTKAMGKEEKKFESASQSFHRAGDGQSSDKIGNQNGACFNSHIHPLISMAMKGALIFFDGGSADDLGLLARNWRGLWGLGDFPFLFVQVQRQGGPVEEDPNARSDSARSSYPGLIESTPRSALVVALDTGVEGEQNIHPPNKRPVGERAALAARALAYGEQIVYSGPLFSGFTGDGGKAMVRFGHVGGGLVAKGGPLEGFAATADGKNWVWANAAIEGDAVAVTAEGIGQIAAVRYAFGPRNPRGNLYNKEGLPASPFQSSLKSP